MKYINNAEIKRLLDPLLVEAALEKAYRSWEKGLVAMQPRFRTELDGFKLVSMGAVLSDLGYAGSKIYSSFQGSLCFRILLFSTETGEAVATLESDALTPIRTAASSVIAARRYANPHAKTLGVFGLGPLGLEHIRQLISAFPIDQVFVCDPFLTAEQVRQKMAVFNVNFVQTNAQMAAEQSEIVVTATRSLTPVFDGSHIQSGCFVAAIGSCLPHAQEIDVTLINRAKRIIVEWPEETLKDTGDFALLSDLTVVETKLEALVETIKKPHAVDRSSDIVIYNAVGIALADIAAAAVVVAV